MSDDVGNDGYHSDDVVERLDPPCVKRASPVAPDRIRLSDTRDAITHKFSIMGGDEDFVPSDKVDDDGSPLYRRVLRPLQGYLTLGLYEDGRPGELFLKIGKAGGVWRVYDALMIAISVALQYGVPIEVFIQKFEHTRFDPSGVTTNPDIPIAKSVADYLARWLKRRYPVDVVRDPKAIGLVPDILDSTGEEDGNIGHSGEV